MSDAIETIETTSVPTEPLDEEIICPPDIAEASFLSVWLLRMRDSSKREAGWIEVELAFVAPGDAIQYVKHHQALINQRLRAYWQSRGPYNPAQTLPMFRRKWVELDAIIYQAVIRANQFPVYKSVPGQ